MGFADKLKDLGDKAKSAAAEHKDEISQAVETAAVVADRRTRGKYQAKISRAARKADGYVEKLTDDGSAAKPAEAPRPPAG